MNNQQYQPLKQTGIWKKYRRMRTARPYRRRTGSLKRKKKPKTGTYPPTGAAAQENDSLSADVPCLCRVHVPDIRTLRQRGRECGKRGRLQRRHTLPAEDGIIADKQKAYEQAMMNRKQQDKIQSLQDFGFTGDDETEEPQDGNRPDAGRRSEAPKGRRCFFGRRLPGHQPPVKHVLRNAGGGRGKRGLETAGGGTDRPTATATERHAHR